MNFKCYDVSLSCTLRSSSNRILSEDTLHDKNDAQASYDNDDYMF